MFLYVIGRKGEVLFHKVILRCAEDIGTFVLRSPKPGTAPSKDSLPLKRIHIFKDRQRQSAIKSGLKNLGTSS